MIKHIKNIFSKKKVKMSRQERRSQEMLRVITKEDDESDPNSFTLEEKSALYEARQCLEALPPTGVDGGLMQKIASSHGVTRQYIHQVFFPKVPSRLFKGRSGSYKSIWAMLKLEIDRHKSSQLYREFSKNLFEKHTVEAKIPKSRIRFLKRRAQEIAEECSMTLHVKEDVATVPTTYQFTLISK